MEKSFYCTDCSHKLEEMKGCGSVSYFCNRCKKLISRKAMLNQEQIVNRVVEKVVQQLDTKNMGWISRP